MAVAKSCVLLLLLMFYCCYSLDQHMITSSAVMVETLECQRNYGMPPFWSHNGTDFSILAAHCSLVVSEPVHINLTYIVENMTGPSEHLTDGNTMWEIDFYFNCTRLDYPVDFMGSLINKTIMATIRIENCNVSWSAINQIGLKVNLLRVHKDFRVNSWGISDLADVDSCARYEGLALLSQLQYSINDVEQEVEISQLLPCQPMIQLARLDIQCRNHTAPHAFCAPQYLKVDTSTLQTVMPHIQYLNLIGVYQHDKSSYSYPIDPNPVKTPFGLQSSSYFNASTSVLRGDEFDRLLSLDTTTSDEMVSNCVLNGSIAYVNIYKTGLRHLPEHYFYGTNKLEYLLISSNKDLTRLPPKLFHRLTHLKSLSLDSNNIRSLSKDQFKDNANLILLNLFGNQLTHLQTGVFAALTSLEVLILRDNINLMTIDQGALPQYSLNLKFIDLKRCNLASIPKDVISLPNLERCDMIGNPVRSLDLLQLAQWFNPINMLVVDPVAFFGERYGQFNPVDYHETNQCELLLPAVDLQSITFSSDGKVSRDELIRLLLLLSVSEMSFTSTDDSKVKCSCDLYHLKQLLHDHRSETSKLIGPFYRRASIWSDINFRTWTCHTYSILPAMVHPYFVMPNESFLCDTDPPPSTGAHSQSEGTGHAPCKYYYRPHDPDRKWLIDCSLLNLTSLPKQLPFNGSAEIISFKMNKVNKLPSCDSGTDDYKWLQVADFLDLAQNDLSSVVPYQLEMFIKTCLKTNVSLNMDNCGLTSLPESIQYADFNKLSISGNQFDCDCKTSWMPKWLKGSRQKVADYHRLKCAGIVNPIVEMTNDDFKCTVTPLLYILPLLAVLAALVSLFILMSYHWVEVKITVYSWFHVRLDQIYKPSKEVLGSSNPGADYLYDIYILYHDSDAEWVKEKLLVGLERRGLKVYVRHRNDPADGFSQSAFVTAIHRSRCVVVVFSNGLCTDNEQLSRFADIDQLSRELNNTGYVVLVKHELSNDDLGRYLSEGRLALFDKYLRSDYYVETGGSHGFWDRLYFWLPEPRGPPEIASTFYSTCGEQSDVPW